MLDDIIANYRGAEVGNYYDGKYRVTEVDMGTIGAIFEKLNGFLSKKDVKIIFLVAEEDYGKQRQRVR